MANLALPNLEDLELPQQRLYFLPLPHGHGRLRGILTPRSNLSAGSVIITDYFKHVRLTRQTCWLLPNMFDNHTIDIKTLIVKHRRRNL